MEIHAVTLVDHDLVIRLYWFKKEPDAPGSGSKVWCQWAFARITDYITTTTRRKKAIKKPILALPS
jgi:hypothetical protein